MRHEHFLEDAGLYRICKATYFPHIISWNIFCKANTLNYVNTNKKAADTRNMKQNRKYCINPENQAACMEREIVNISFM